MNDFENDEYDFESQEFNPEEARAALMDYYGTAMEMNPVAMMELERIEQMSDEELIAEAKDLGIIC